MWTSTPSAQDSRGRGAAGRDVEGRHCTYDPPTCHCPRVRAVCVEACVHDATRPCPRPLVPVRLCLVSHTRTSVLERESLSLAAETPKNVQRHAKCGGEEGVRTLRAREGGAPQQGLAGGAWEGSTVAARHECCTHGARGQLRQRQRAGEGGKRCPPPPLLRARRAGCGGVHRRGGGVGARCSAHTLAPPLLRRPPPQHKNISEGGREEEGGGQRDKWVGVCVGGGSGGLRQGVHGSSPMPAGAVRGVGG